MRGGGWSGWWFCGGLVCSLGGCPEMILTLAPCYIKTSGVSPLLPLPPPLSLTSALPLPLLPRASLAGHGVAAVWVPLHVADTPHGLELGAAGAVLVEVPVVALLQQELAAAVSRELVSHPAAVTQETSQGVVLVISTFKSPFRCSVLTFHS